MGNNNLDSLLDLRGKRGSDIPKEFDIIAKELFNNYEIKKGKQRYRFLEIEFYYYSEQHKDSPIYERTCERGWFFHQSGVDISFYSDEKEYGGILIRSIENLDTKKITTGPLRVAYKLFDFIKFGNNGKADVSSIPILVPAKEKFNVHLRKEKRFNISNEKQYRYLDKRAKLNWNNQYVKNVNCSGE
jgi:hypothetical protein